MTTVIQIVENSDRFHVSRDNTPVFTTLFNPTMDRERGKAETKSQALAFNLALSLQDEGYKIKLLPTCKK